MKTIGFLKRTSARLAVGLVVLTASSSALMATQATAAHALGSPNIAVDVQSQAPGVGMAQVGITGCNFHNTVSVWYGVHDTTSTDPNAWYGGWAETDQFNGGNGLNAIPDPTVGWVHECSGSESNFTAIISVPTTSCGDPMRADATDSDGTATPTVYFTLECLSAPRVAATQSPASLGDVIGKGQVELTGTGAVPGRSQRIWVGIHDTTKPGDYHGGWISSDLQGSFKVTTTDIQPSSCGHLFTAYVIDNASTPAVASNTLSFTLYCGPQLIPSGWHGYTGQWFTPGVGLTVVLTDLSSPTHTSSLQYPQVSLATKTPQGGVVGGGTIGNIALPTCDAYQVQAFQGSVPILPITIPGCNN